MEPEGSLPHSPVPATCPYPEPHRSSQAPTSYFLKIHLNTILPQWTRPIQVPTIPSTKSHDFSRCLGRTRVSVHVRGFLYDFRNMIRFYCEELLAPRQNSPSWRTTPCQLSATACLIHSQLPSLLEAVSLTATWGSAMPCWQGPTYHLQKSCPHENDTTPNSFQDTLIFYKINNEGKFFIVITGVK